jgi:hypothetical protein
MIESERQPAEICILPDCERVTCEKQNYESLCEHHAEFFSTLLWIFNNTTVVDMLYQAFKVRLLHEQQPQQQKPNIWVPN